MADLTTYRFKEHESRDPFPLSLYAPDSYEIALSAEGASLLSTVFVKNCPVGASISVDFYDFGPGDGTLAGEKIIIGTHSVITTSSTSDRKIIYGVHNKVRCRMVVTGGTVEAGVHVTVGQFGQKVQIDNEPIEVTLGKKTAVTIENLSMITSGTEYSYALPVGTKEFNLYARNNAEMKVAYVSGGTSLKWKTIPVGVEHTVTGLDPAISWTVYISANKNSTVAEIESWT